MATAQVPEDFGVGRLFWAIREAVIVANAGTGRIALWNPAAEALALSTWEQRWPACDTNAMKDDVAPTSYSGYRFPAEIISHAVWLYFRFALSYRDVEELLAERGVIVTYESIRQWARRFGQCYANGLQRRRPRPGDTWHLDGLIATPVLALNSSGSVFRPSATLLIAPAHG